MKRAAVAVLALCLSHAAMAQSPPPPPPQGTFAIGKPHVCLEEYPKESVIADEQGTTLLGFRITTEGTTTAIQVLQSSGSTRLDDAAKACVTTWRYRPAMQDGQPVEVPWKAQVKWVMHYLTPDFEARAALAKCAATYTGTPHLSGPLTELVVFLAKGVPTDVRVKRSAGDQELDAYALSCAKKIPYLAKDESGELVSGLRLMPLTWSEVLPGAK